jgi:hypothetical protein
MYSSLLQSVHCTQLLTRMWSCSSNGRRLIGKDVDRSCYGLLQVTNTLCLCLWTYFQDGLEFCGYSLRPDRIRTWLLWNWLQVKCCLDSLPLNTGIKFCVTRSIIRVNQMWLLRFGHLC